MIQFGWRFGGDLCQDPAGERFPKFDSPLVKRVNVPQASLGENLVFVEGDQLAQHSRCQTAGQNHIGGSIPREDAEGYLAGDLPPQPSPLSMLGLRAYFR